MSPFILSGKLPAGDWSSSFPGRTHFCDCFSLEVTHLFLQGQGSLSIPLPHVISVVPLVKPEDGLWYIFSLLVRGSLTELLLYTCGEQNFFHFNLLDHFLHIQDKGERQILSALLEWDGKFIHCLSLSVFPGHYCQRAGMWQWWTQYKLLTHGARGNSDVNHNICNVQLARALLTFAAILHHFICPFLNFIFGFCISVENHLPFGMLCSGRKVSIWEGNVAFKSAFETSAQ